MSPTPRNAVVYVASKKRYVEEALRSVSSLRRYSHNIQIYLKTTRDLETDETKKAFDRIVELENPVGSYIDKSSFLENIPEQRVMFLDGDTLVCGSLEPAFALLDRFEVAVSRAPHRFGGVDGQSPLLANEGQKISSAFYEFNTGVIIARNTPEVRSAFRKWPKHQRAGDLHDQPSFARLLWHENLSFFVLPPEYNARVTSPIFLGEEARIVHARLKDMEGAARILNKKSGPRVVSPDELD